MSEMPGWEREWLDARRRAEEAVALSASDEPLSAERLDQIREIADRSPLFERRAIHDLLAERDRMRKADHDLRGDMQRLCKVLYVLTQVLLGNEWVGRPSADVAAEAGRVAAELGVGLAGEVRRLRGLVTSLADRCAGQSEALSRRAEKEGGAG